jgi:hypothetical protein
MKKPFVLFERKKKQGSKKSKRLRAPMHDQKTQCEWYEAAPQKSPELCLGIAVLQRAIMDLITVGVDPRDRENALMYICGGWGEEHEKDYAYSFTNIIMAISDISIQEFRKKILHFLERAKCDELIADHFRFQRGFKNPKIALPKTPALV